MDHLIIVIVAAALYAAIRCVIKAKKKGKGCAGCADKGFCGSDGGCSSCKYYSSCQSDNKNANTESSSDNDQH